MYQVNQRISILINNGTIRVTDTAKNLGLIMANKLRFTAHIRLV